MKLKSVFSNSLLVVSFVVLATGISSAIHQAQDTFQPTRTSNDAPVPARGKLGQDLFIALDHHDLAVVKNLLKNGADPNSRNGLEFSPIYIAAASHQLDAMKALVDAGANPNTHGVYGSPLLFASASAHEEGVKYLLSLGADVNAKRTDRITALMEATDAGYPPLVAELLDNKADINAKDVSGTTALALAARKGNIGAGQILLERGATVNTADVGGQTPLMAAAMNGHLDFVKALLAKGADVNAKDKKGRTALILAATYGDYPEVEKTLLDAGANPKAKDLQGRTAAMLASRHGFTETASLLGMSGVNPKIPTSGVAVGRSVKVMQETMGNFNQYAACVSCHHEGLGRMATGEAADHGITLTKKVQKAVAGSVDGVVKALQPLHEKALTDPESMKQLPLIEINEIATTYSWLLNGMAAHHEAPTPGSTAMAMCLAEQQAPDGSWTFSVPREPMQSSFFTFTALTVRALKTYGDKAKSAELDMRYQKARSWFMQAKPKSSEDRAFRLLGLKWTGASKEAIDSAAKEVLADQRTDGGWSQLPNQSSDAYATGEALYALHHGGGVPTGEAAYTRGTKYLLRTQDDDGSWYVVKRANPANNYFDSGFPHGESQYASFNGTCWATMALLDTVGKRKVRHG